MTSRGKIRGITTASTGDLHCAARCASPPVSARNAGAVMRTLAGLEQKEMDFETARIPARWAAGAR